MTSETPSPGAETRASRSDRRWPYLPVEPGGAVAARSTPACRLPAPELRERAREIREAFAPGILEVEELEDGFVYWFDRTETWFERVTAFALFESRCCDFLDFEVGLQAAGRRISLRISGPGEAKRFLADARYGDPQPREEVS